MSERLQLRRGTAIEVYSDVPTSGEPWVDTTNNRINIGDGTTEGGWPAAKLTETAYLSLIAREVNLAVLGDTLVKVALPPNVSRFGITQIILAGASAVPGNATLGLYTGPNQSGATIVGQNPLDGITSISANTAGNIMQRSVSGNTSYVTNEIYINVGTINATPLTVDVIITISPL